MGECILVGHIVADEDDGVGAQHRAEPLQRPALVGVHHGQFDDALALAEVNAVEPARSVDDPLSGSVPGGGVGAAVVERDT